jgi:hypothetical protein
LAKFVVDANIRNEVMQYSQLRQVGCICGAEKRLGRNSRHTWGNRIIRTYCDEKELEGMGPKSKPKTETSVDLLVTTLHHFVEVCIEN